MLAAAPAWFADNVAQITLVTLAVVTVLVLRLVQQVTVRLVLLGLVLVVAVFIYVNRGPLAHCARTCECDIAGRHVTVPTCDSDLRR